MALKLRKLESRLQRVNRSFDQPKILLEQYSTPPHIAAHLLFTAQTHFDDICNRIVADFGSGCGTLGIGATVLGAAAVIGFEIDTDAIQICSQNIFHECVDNFDLVQCDVLRDLLGQSFNKPFDTVVMNPPFGTKFNAGIDLKFLKVALKCASNSVYSLHKTSTRRRVLKMSEEFGVATSEVLAELKFNLTKTYKFQKHNNVDIDVDLIRFAIQN